MKFVMNYSLYLQHNCYYKTIIVQQENYYKSENMTND